MWGLGLLWHCALPRAGAADAVFSVTLSGVGAGRTVAFPAGWTAAVASDELVAEVLACPAGRYCPAGSQAPLVCPLGAYSAATGLATAAAACGAPCAANSYCPDPGLQYPCPTNTNSPPGSVSQANCACDRGYSCLYNRAMTVTLHLGVTAAAWAADPVMRAQAIAAVAAAAGVPPSSVQVMAVMPLDADGNPARRRLGDGAEGFEGLAPPLATRNPMGDVPAPGRRRLDYGEGAAVTLQVEGAEGFEGLERRLADACPSLRGARAMWRHGSRVRALHDPRAAAPALGI
jgi:hypothetical protein